MNSQAGEYAGEVGARGVDDLTWCESQRLNNVQYLGDEGEVGDVGEYFGDEGDMCAGAG